MVWLLCISVIYCQPNCCMRSSARALLLVPKLRSDRAFAVWAPLPVPYKDSFMISAREDIFFARVHSMVVSTAGSHGKYKADFHKTRRMRLSPGKNKNINFWCRSGQRAGSRIFLPSSSFLLLLKQAVFKMS